MTDCQINKIFNFREFEETYKYVTSHLQFGYILALNATLVDKQLFGLIENLCIFLDRE